MRFLGKIENRWINMDEYPDYESLECMYSELVRINDELIQIDNSRISRANNIIIFNGAIISILILAPFNILDKINNPVVFLFIIPSIFFWDCPISVSDS